ncbi:MAG: hypothetical protein KBA33_09795 [Cloacibacterium sp.]|nr:hypothetical protein [Cloacibacterium sp.]
MYLKKKHYLLILVSSICYSQTGNVGINTTQPTHTLHVKSTGNPLRLEGLQPDATTADQVMMADNSGVAKTIDVTSVSSYAEPWYNMDTNTASTSNNQSIYSLGDIGIGTNKKSIMDTRHVMSGGAIVSENNLSKVSLYLDAAQHLPNTKYKSTFTTVVDNGNGKGFDDTRFYSFANGTIGPWINDIKFASRGSATAPQPLNNPDVIYQQTSTAFLGGSYNAFMPLALYQVRYAGDGTNVLSVSDWYNSGRSAIKISANNNVGINYNSVATSTLYSNGSLGAKIAFRTGQILDDDFTVIASGDVTLPTSGVGDTGNQGRIYNISFLGPSSVTVYGEFLNGGVIQTNYTLSDTDGHRSITVQSIGNRWLIIGSH